MTESTYRIDRRTLAGDWPVWLVLAADVAFAAWAFGSMPDQIPIHWNAAGVADRWGAPLPHLIAMPAVAMAIYLLTLLAPLIDPRRANYALFSGTLRLVRWLTPLLLLVVHAVTIAAALEWPVRMNMAVGLLMGLLFILFGNVMGRVRHNYFVGIRLPWTLADEENWQRTHRVAGPVWVAAGLVMMAGAFLPGAWFAAGLVASFLLAFLVPVLYSYRLHVQKTKE